MKYRETLREKEKAAGLMTACEQVNAPAKLKNSPAQMIAFSNSSILNTQQPEVPDPNQVVADPFRFTTWARERGTFRRPEVLYNYLLKQ